MEKNQNTELSDGTKLCLDCGLCCVGVFHTRAEIYTDKDREYAKAFNADFVFEEDKEYFKLSCPAYDSKCTIYPHNPSVCQKHECDLLKSVNNCTTTLKESSIIVQEMKKIINNMEEDFKTFTFITDTKCISNLFRQFLSLTSKGERKNYQNIIKNYTAFFHLKKKRFYK